MKVGVIGSGDVGRRLGQGFAAKGHDVKLGTRDPTKKEVQAWLKETAGKVSVGSFAEAAAHGEVVLLCTLGSAAESAIGLAGEKNFAGKVLIDVTNPLDFSKGMPPGLFVGTTDSLGERVQRKLPQAKVVKCFNIVSNSTMINPRLKDGLPTMIIAGNDAGAKKTVAEILAGFGWEAPVDIGNIDGARWLEALTALWVRVAINVGSWTPGFRVLKQ
jgi:8-hydroxy-5-deazaflavin:NADPH oxidoreductase